MLLVATEAGLQPERIPHKVAGCAGNNARLDRQYAIREVLKVGNLESVVDSVG